MEGEEETEVEKFLRICGLRLSLHKLKYNFLGKLFSYAIVKLVLKESESSRFQKSLV